MNDLRRKRVPTDGPSTTERLSSAGAGWIGPSMTRWASTLATSYPSATPAPPGSSGGESRSGTMAQENIVVTNNEDAQRYEALVGGRLSILQYEPMDNRIVYLHAEVPPALE